MLVGTIWCGGPHDGIIKEEQGESAEWIPVSPAPVTFSSQLSAESAEWIPVGHRSNHSKVEREFCNCPWWKEHKRKANSWQDMVKVQWNWMQ